MKYLSGFCDTFSDPRAPGRVVGSVGSAGVRRSGVDRDKAISIDHGAARFQPLLDEGWGKQGLAYGPYRRKPGLAVAVGLLNGHNASQSGGLGESLRERMWQWLVGHGNERGRQRLIRWLRGGRRRRTMAQMRRWVHLDRRLEDRQIDENLALGWFASAAPVHPEAKSNALLMHASGADNGELWATVGGCCCPTLSGIQNVPMLYVVVLRQRGAIYYAASSASACGSDGAPRMRPIAIDCSGCDEELYAGVHQSVLGQIGFRVDTRVYGVGVAELPDAAWFGSACSAHALTSRGERQLSTPAVGPLWHQTLGWFELTEHGAVPRQVDCVARVPMDAPVGLIHALLHAPQEGDLGGAGDSGDVEGGRVVAGGVGLLWRAKEKTESYWSVLVGAQGARLWLRNAGQRTLVADEPTVRCIAGKTHSLQVLDDGQSFCVIFDGTPVFGGFRTDGRLAGAHGVGIIGERTAFAIRAFEAHPLGVPIPPSLRLPLPSVHPGDRVVVEDRFEGPQRSLSGSKVTTGNRAWQKSLGLGEWVVTGDGNARVVADVHKPNPGRTIHTVGWEHPAFADLQLDITPPGRARGQGHEGRAGAVFWQDPNNYVLVSTWLHDKYGGASVSSFYCLDGFEDVYDAVWSNVGERIVWGKRYSLRVIFDGHALHASVDGVSVLYRGLTDVYADAQGLRIERVGIVANWEWGDDTGSVLHRFVARGR